MSWRNEGAEVRDEATIGESWEIHKQHGSYGAGGMFVSSPEEERQYALRHHYLEWREQFRAFTPCSQKEQKMMEWCYLRKKYDASCIVALVAEWLCYKASQQDASYFTMMFRYKTDIVFDITKLGLSHEEIVAACLAYLDQGEAHRQAQRAVFKEKYDAC